MTQSTVQVMLRWGEPRTLQRPSPANPSAVCPMSRLTSRPLNPVAARGFSLVEVLVAVVVLAVGLLGMASLQISVLKANESARLRTVAIHASYDLSDRIRADPAAVFGRRGLKAVILGSACTGTPPTIRWQQEFCAFGLPAPLTTGASALEVDCAAPITPTGCGTGNCEIIVRWNDSRGDSRNQTPHDTFFSVCTRIPQI